MKTIRILILEDDLKTLSVLLNKIHLLEEEFSNNKISKDIAVTVLSEYTQVEEYANKKDSDFFDIILLDRDCKACGSFHCLDFNKFNKDKIISISAIPDWNQEAQDSGVKRITWKDHSEIESFGNQVIEEVKSIINSDENNNSQR